MKTENNLPLYLSILENGTTISLGEYNAVKETQVLGVHVVEHLPGELILVETLEVFATTIGDFVVKHTEVSAEGFMESHYRINNLNLEEFVDTVRAEIISRVNASPCWSAKFFYTQT